MVLMLFLIWLGFKALEYAGFIDLKDPRNWRGLPIWWLNLTTGIVGIFQPFEAIWACEKPKPDPKDRFRNQKLLFVCNHQLSAFDVPLLLSVVYLETGVFTRGLADKLHYSIPIWAQLGTIFGTFSASRKTCAMAMEKAYPLIVFPGGSSEVWRPSHLPKYSLLWGERKGFARMALDHGYTIIPMSAAGMDDMWYSLFDIPAYLFFKLMGDEKRAARGDTIPFLIPSFQFQKQYFYFGEPIKTEGLPMTEESVNEIRDKTKVAVERGIDILKGHRSKDVNRYFGLDFLFSSKKELH